MYFYILDKEQKWVFEIKCARETADRIAEACSPNENFYETFPYEAAGYSDPYSFMEEYKVINVEGEDVVIEGESDV